jgi:triosephosphate isomerase
MGRKLFVGGNWKMNGDKASIDTIIEFLKSPEKDPNTGKEKERKKEHRDRLSLVPQAVTDDDRR